MKPTWRSFWLSISHTIKYPAINKTPWTYWCHDSPLLYMFDECMWYYSCHTARMLVLLPLLHTVLTVLVTLLQSTIVGTCNPNLILCPKCPQSQVATSWEYSTHFSWGLSLCWSCCGTVWMVWRCCPKVWSWFRHVEFVKLRFVIESNHIDSTTISIPEWCTVRLILLALVNHFCIVLAVVCSNL